MSESMQIGGLTNRDSLFRFRLERNWKGLGSRLDGARYVQGLQCEIICRRSGERSERHSEMRFESVVRSDLGIARLYLRFH